MPRPLSNELLSSDDSSSQQNSSSSSATEFLHKFSAVYIGSVPSGKSHNMDAMIDKVLMEMKPSMAKFVAVSLSLLEVQFVEERKAVAGDQDVEDEMGVFLSHDTSRIRSVGAYGADKRFAGYIMKEEGKPMTGHVIKCNSAALMVSVTSFLRQSCQLTSHQRGGAFYEELSTDESGDWEGTSFEVWVCKCMCMYMYMCMYMCMCMCMCMYLPTRNEGVDRWKLAGGHWPNFCHFAHYVRPQCYLAQDQVTMK